ncbi:hypothetical protein PIROE2DRAFT_7934, partial [Piromyces sp. E2]
LKNSGIEGVYANLETLDEDKHARETKQILYKFNIVKSLITSMVTLIECLDIYNINIEDKENQEIAKYIKENANEIIQNYRKDPKLPKDFFDKIEKLWTTEKAIKQIYDKKEDIDIDENAE